MRQQHFQLKTQLRARHNAEQRELIQRQVEYWESETPSGLVRRMLKSKSVRKLTKTICVKLILRMMRVMASSKEKYLLKSKYSNTVKLKIKMS